MKQMISILIALFLLNTIVLAQVSDRVSQRIILDSVKLRLERAKKKATGCSDFKIHSTPAWAGTNANSRAYYKSCMWSGTYIIVNADSTYLFLHNGEGAANYAQQGNWSITKDSILVFKASDSLTNEFRIRMKQFETTNYKSYGLLSRKLVLHETELLEFNK